MLIRRIFNVIGFILLTFMIIVVAFILTNVVDIFLPETPVSDFIFDTLPMGIARGAFATISWLPYFNQEVEDIVISSKPLIGLDGKTHGWVDEIIKGKITRREKILDTLD